MKYELRIVTSKLLVWYPPGRKRKGRTRNLLMQKVISGMKEI